MTVFEIKIYFDTICPWVGFHHSQLIAQNPKLDLTDNLQCYIGHRSLAKAIELYQRTYPGGSSDAFSFILLPYYLRPDFLPDDASILWEEAAARKNGEERVNAIRTRLQRVGRAFGIEFSFHSKIGNTRDSHRLIRYAAPAKRKELLEAIYSMHFEQDGDINSHVELAKAAASVGMDEGEVLEMLNGDEGAVEVDQLAAEARKNDVTGVPNVQIGERRIEGAEDVGEFYEALVAAKEALMN